MNETLQKTKRKSIPSYSLESLERALDILGLFAYDKRSFSFTEIVKLSNLNKSTVFRTLSTLQAKGYIQRDPVTRRYLPSIKLLQLGFAALSNLEYREIARPYLEKLAFMLNETASLAVLDDMKIVYIDRVRNRAIVGIVLGIGSHIYAHCTSLGKVLLADLDPSDLDSRLSRTELVAYTSRTIVDKALLKKELTTIRQRGYASCDGELAPNLRTVAACIRDATGRAIASINVSGTNETMDLDRMQDEIIPAVVNSAADISLSLGYVSNR